MYEKEYFVGVQALFGYSSVFYRIISWVKFLKVVSLIRKFRGVGTTLDIGCALGHSLVRFKSAGMKPIGCDVSAWATKEARKMHPHIIVIRADALALPFKSEIFEVITAFETLEHCSNLVLAIREIERVVKPEGLVIISVPTSDLNDTFEDKTHYWHLSLKEWLIFFKSYFEVLGVDYFLKFMKFVDGKTCNTFLALRVHKD